MTSPGLKPCACGCGELVKGTWKRGHSVRGEGGFGRDRPPPLPGPDEEFVGETEPDPDIPEWVNEPRLGPQVPVRPPLEQDDLEDEEPEPDPEPGWLRAVPGGKDAPRTPPRKTTRVTAATRKDIEAKIGLMIEMPGRIWQARDPICGGAFVEAAPNIRGALAELVVQSPDLVAWFTGGGGGFMLWLNLAMACQPVLTAVWAHHVAHSVDVRRDEAGRPVVPNYSEYAA